MKIKPSVFGFRLRRVGLRRPIPAGLVGLLSLICGARVQAGEGSLPLIRSAVVSAPSESIGWMSGGVGEADRAEMHKSAAAYNVWVVFSDRSGSLRNQLLYPRQDRSVSDEELLDVLAQANLPYIAARVGGLDGELD